MKDSVLHKIYNNVNSKKRNCVVEFMHDIVNVNTEISANHVIIEPESTREDISKSNFEKMAKIEDIIEMSKLNIYLKSVLVEKTAKLQEAKNLYNEAVN